MNSNGIFPAQNGEQNAAARIYAAITGSTVGRASTGWIPEIYPTENTAFEAYRKGELFVYRLDGRVVATARINREQMDAYRLAKWKYVAPDNEVMVLHTLSVDPACSGRGIATAFVAFYEQFARENGCLFLRMDTNAVNTPARSLYKRLGYREAGIVPCNFCGIPNVNLVCLEKNLGLWD